MSKCSHCKKKLGLMEYKCKCDKLFCITHLAYEEHSCSYDYKSELKDKLKEQLNTGVLRDKMERI